MPRTRSRASIGTGLSASASRAKTSVAGTRSARADRPARGASSSSDDASTRLSSSSEKPESETCARGERMRSTKDARSAAARAASSGHPKVFRMPWPKNTFRRSRAGHSPSTRPTRCRSSKSPKGAAARSTSNTPASPPCGVNVSLSIQRRTVPASSSTFHRRSWWSRCEVDRPSRIASTARRARKRLSRSGSSSTMGRLNAPRNSLSVVSSALAGCSMASGESARTTAAAVRAAWAACAEFHRGSRGGSSAPLSHSPASDSSRAASPPWSNAASPIASAATASAGSSRSAARNTKCGDRSRASSGAAAKPVETAEKIRSSAAANGSAASGSASRD